MVVGQRNVENQRMDTFRLGWASDLHWDFANPDRRLQFSASVVDAQLSALVVTGDIATRRRLPAALDALDQLGIPVYFTTGNHDYYTGSFAVVDDELRKMCAQSRHLTRLGSGEIIRLTSTAVLVGHGGWADGQAGLGINTTITTNDSWLIKDLALPKIQLFEETKKLGEASASYLTTILPSAARQARHVLIATHVPPFASACFHAGKPAAAEYLPHYVNQAMGEALIRVARDNPLVTFEILAGHTHERCCIHMAANLKVRVSAAEPCHPQLESILEL